MFAELKNQTMSLDHVTWVEIDLCAYQRNIRKVLSLVGPYVKLFAVCKADAYGMGAVKIGKAAISAGAYGLAISDPADAEAIRHAGLTAPLLLYACTPPDCAAEIVEKNVIVTIHDFESLSAFSKLKRKVDVFLKLDCGFGRLGFQQGDWTSAFAAAHSATNINVTGLYTHFGHTENSDLMEVQGQLFRQAANEAETVGLHDLDLMAASSRVVIGYPDLFFNAVNTGGLLFGVLEHPWCNHISVDPVLSSVKSRIIQIKHLPPGAFIGYNEPIASQSAVKIAVVPFGFRNGYPRLPAGGRVLVGGKFAPIIGPRGTEHTVINITGITGAKVGSEVVFLGHQEDQIISIVELSDFTSIPLIELVPRLSSGSQRIYLQ